MPNDENKLAYKIGYGKPPEHRRFKGGESGNCKGRPKGAKNLTTIVSNALKEKVKINVNGKRKSVNKLEVAITQLVNKAVSGDQKALSQLLPLAQIIENRAAESIAQNLEPGEADQLTMESILRRIREKDAPAATESTPANPSPSEKEPTHDTSGN